MAVFAVMVTEDNSEKVKSLSLKIAQTYPNEFMELGKGIWLVSAPEIFQPKLVFDALLPEHTTSSLVVPVNAFWGIQDPSVWNWIQQRMK